jgi:hypothetical protein
MQLHRLLLLIGVAATILDGAIITSGFVKTTTCEYGSFSITAENSITFTTGIVPIEVYSGPLNCPCPLGASLSLSGVASPDGAWGDPDLAVNAVPRGMLVWILLNFTSTQVTLTEAEVYTAPFTASGHFSAGRDEFVDEIFVPLTGRGFVTLELDTWVFPETGLEHTVRSLTYEFN